jgi:sortase (surface protein transpeptidase)
VALLSAAAVITAEAFSPVADVGSPPTVVDEAASSPSTAGPIEVSTTGPIQPSTTAPPSVAPTTTDAVEDPTGEGAPGSNPRATTTATTPVPPPPQVSPPVGLRIPTLDIDAVVSAYGVDADTGEMEVPDNVTEVAWYRFGPAPGAPGSAVLAAHVDLAGQGPGVFFELGRLEPDDLVEVAHEDGTVSSYRVVARTVYEKEEVPLEAIFARDGRPVLTLVTCGGGFSRSTRRYDSNVVVSAVPIAGDEVDRTGAGAPLRR